MKYWSIGGLLGAVKVASEEGKNRLSSKVIPRVIWPQPTTRYPSTQHCYQNHEGGKKTIGNLNWRRLNSYRVALKKKLVTWSKKFVMWFVLRDPLIGNIVCKVVIYFAFVRTLWFRKSFCTLWTPLALKCTFNWKSGSMFWLFFVRNDESDSERNGSTWCRALRHVVLLIAITRHFLNHVIRIEPRPVQIPNGVFTTLVILIVYHAVEVILPLRY